MAAAKPRLMGEGVDFLALLPKARRQQLLNGSTRVDFPAGTIAFRPDESPTSFLVERGLFRLYRSLPDGRQATVAFVYTGELVGGMRAMGTPPSVFAQVVVDSTVKILEASTLHKLAASHIDVVNGIGRHLAAHLDNAFRLISIRSLGDIRDRLAYDILERACRHQLGVGRLEVHATHAELADSIGSSREVVSRTIKGFRAAGVVETAPGVIRIAEPMRLAGIVRAFAI